ncbi:hypothetical protein FACS189462_0250 [Spirochaetia bacterium]|nr:hypothetical protein FACS189462_0250 [Spirochaetia bacterium]
MGSTGPLNRNKRKASREIDAYHRLGIPVMIEAMAKGVIDGKPFPSNDPRAIKMAARMAKERK